MNELTAVGQQTTEIDPRGYSTYIDYAALWRLTVELDPLDNATYYQYDSVGNLLARTDGKGQTAYFEYDGVSRQIAANYAAVQRVYFQYDLAGNRTLMLDEWGATYRTYHAMRRPISRHDARGTVVYYAYGDGGERAELTVLGHGTVYYKYNAVANMEHVLDGKTDKATYYQYDGAGKVTVKDADASVLVRFAYTRDAAGNPIAIERGSGLGACYYQYDQLQRPSYEGQFVSAARQYETATAASDTDGH